MRNQPGPKLSLKCPELLRFVPLHAGHAGYAEGGLAGPCVLPQSSTQIMTLLDHLKNYELPALLGPNLTQQCRTSTHEGYEEVVLKRGASFHSQSPRLTLRVQVPNIHILTQNLYYNYYYPNPKYLINGYMGP